MMKLLLLCSLLAGVAFSCQEPDCDNPDCGTCGNACCMMEFKFAVAIESVYPVLIGSLKAGGPDHNYTFINSTDVHDLKLTDGVHYMIKAKHTSSHTNSSSLNLVLKSTESTITYLKGFSISNAEGAYCDGGQNYKNLVGFVKGLAQLYAQKNVFGCSNSSNTTQTMYNR